MDTDEITKAFYFRKAKKYFVFTSHYYSFEEKYLGVLNISNH